MKIQCFSAHRGQARSSGPRPSRMIQRCPLLPRGANICSLGIIFTIIDWKLLWKVSLCCTSLSGSFKGCVAESHMGFAPSASKIMCCPLGNSKPEFSVRRIYVCSCLSLSFYLWGYEYFPTLVPSLKMGFWPIP